MITHGQECGEQRQHKQRPFGGTADDKAAQYEECNDDGAKVERAVGHTLASEVFGELGHQPELVIALHLEVAMRTFVKRQRDICSFFGTYGRSTLDIGN